MLTFTLFALIVIVLAALLYLGYNWDENQRHLAEATDAQRAAFADIMKAKLRSEGKLVGPEEYEPDFMPAVIAIVLIALCALGGLTHCTVFFTMCFAAICFQIADVLKAKLVVQWVENNINPEVATA